MDVEVLYLDNHLLVVAKPPGVLVQADRTGDPDLLSMGKALLKERFRKPGNVFLGLVHRLDRPASGVVVFARTSKAAGRLSDQFRRRIPEKRYLAIVQGAYSGGTRLVHFLAKQDQRVRVVREDEPGAMRSELECQVLAQEDKLTLLDVRLITGRPHQVRIQCADSGHPLLGDMRYGAQRTLDGRNLALHGYSLGLAHPIGGGWVSWQVPPPQSWGSWFARAIAEALVAAAGPRKATIRSTDQP